MKKQDYEDSSDKFGEIIRGKLEQLDYSYQESSWEKLNHQLGNYSSSYFFNMTSKDIFWASLVICLIFTSSYFAYENHQLRHSKERIIFLEKPFQETPKSDENFTSSHQKAQNNYSTSQPRFNTFQINTSPEKVNHTLPNTNTSNLNYHKPFLTSQNLIHSTVKPFHFNFSKNLKRENTLRQISQKPTIIYPKKVATLGLSQKTQTKKKPKHHWQTGISGGMEIDQVNLAEGLYAQPQIGITQEIDFAKSPIRLSISALYTRKFYRFNQLSTPPTNNITNNITFAIMQSVPDNKADDQAPQESNNPSETNDEGDLLVNQVSSHILEFPVEVKYFIKPQLFIGAGWSSYLFKNQDFGFDPNIGEGFIVDTQQARNQNFYSGILMFSSGFETPLSSNLRLQLQAYYKYPLVSVGVEKAQIQSFGIRSHLFFRWGQRR